MTFHQNNNQCFLYKSCSTIDDACNECVTSERRCIDETEPARLTKLAYFGGLEDDIHYSKSVLVMDLDDPDLVCDNLGDLPNEFSLGSGGVFQKKRPMYCEGFYDEAQCNCYEYRNSTWVTVPEPSVCRANEGFTEWSGRNDYFAVAGGTNYDRVVTNSAEYFDGDKWTTIANLPFNVSLNCLVGINDTTMMSIGGTGYNGTTAYYPTDTYFYDFNADIWYRGPDLPYHIDAHSCATVNWRNSTTGQVDKYVAVIGGFTLKGISNQIHLLNLNDVSSGWTAGPEFTDGVVFAVLVEFGESLVLTGGYRSELDDNHLYQLSSPEGPWIKMPQSMPRERRAHLAFLIPDELVECH